MSNILRAPNLAGFTRSHLLDLIIQGELKLNSNGDTGLYSIKEESSTSNLIITRTTSGTEVTIFTLTPAGNLTITGSISFGSLEITGDFTVDTTTFHVDSTANNVGIGTITPDSALHILSSETTEPTLHIENSSGIAGRDAILKIETQFSIACSVAVR